MIKFLGLKLHLTSGYFLISEIDQRAHTAVLIESNINVYKVALTPSQLCTWRSQFLTVTGSMQLFSVLIFARIEVIPKETIVT
jgi:hypothetical protein